VFQKRFVPVPTARYPSSALKGRLSIAQGAATTVASRSGAEPRVYFHCLSLGLRGKLEPPEVELPLGEDRSRQEPGLLDQPALGTQEQRKDLARTPFTEGANLLLDAGHTVEGGPRMHPALGQGGQEQVGGSPRLDLPVDFAHPPQGHNVDELHTSQNGPGLARSGAVPMRENLGDHLGRTGSKLLGTRPRFEAGGVDVDPAAIGGLPGAVFDRFPTQAEPIGPWLMDRQHPHDAPSARGNRSRRKT